MQERIITKLSRNGPEGFAGGEFEKGFVDGDSNGFWVGGATAVGEGSVTVIPMVSMVTTGSKLSGLEESGSNSDISFSHAGGREVGGRGGREGGRWGEREVGMRKSVWSYWQCLCSHLSWG